MLRSAMLRFAMNAICDESSIPVMTHLDDAIVDTAMRVAEITHRKISLAQYSRKAVCRPKLGARLKRN